MVARPGDEASYLGAILEIFHRQGSELGVLTFTRGEESPYNDSLQRLDSVRMYEFCAATSVLRVAHRRIVDFPEAELCRLPVERLAEHVIRMMSGWDVDLIVTVDGRRIDRTAAAAACWAGRAHDVPVLAWTLPHKVAHAVMEASGMTVAGDSDNRIDFELTVDRGTQRYAMRAHQSQHSGAGHQLARLTVQGDREWMRWLVPAGVSAPVEEVRA